MKSVHFISCLASLGLLAGIAGFGCAHEQTRRAPNSKEAGYLTGSYLPQEVHRNGPVTDGKDNVRVLGQSELNRSGGANVQESLHNLGVTQ